MKSIVVLVIGLVLGSAGYWIYDTTQEKAASTATSRTKSDSTGKNDQLDRKVRIGFSTSGTDHGWLGAIKRNAIEAAKDFSDVDLIVMDAQNSSEKQMADLESLIQQKVDVIVMLPHSGKALTPAAAKIKDAGIPLIVVDRRIESDDFFAYIGGDNYGIGVAAAQFIGKKLNGKGRVIEIMGLAGISVTSQRHQGFVDTLKKDFPEVEVVASVAADFNADKALTVTESLLQAQPEVDAIYSHDDDMSVGILQAVKQLGRDQNLFITGAGGSKLMMEKIQEGTSPVAASFLYNPSMAGSAVNLARLVAQNRGMSDLWEPEVAREILIRASEVNQGNVARFIRLGY